MTPSESLTPAKPRGGELAGLVRVPFEVAAEGIGLIEGIHLGVAQRAFGSTGPLGRPAQSVHNAIAGLVYGFLKKAATGLGSAASAAAGPLVPAELQDVSRTRRGANLIGAVNGIVGDRLASEQSAASIEMAVRAGGRSVPSTAPGLLAAFPDATPRIAIFVHGLCGSDQNWIPLQDPGLGFPARLEAELGYTPVLIRYNSGLHISANGRSLAALLEELQAGWPCDLAEIVLIGHSMGGLVARSACHYGRQAGAAWTSRVRHVISLGSPHLGAPLEKAVNAATNGLGLLPETKALGTFLNRRSAGIKDLRYGAIVDEDWLERDPDAFLQDHCQPVALLEGAGHHAIAATVTADAGHPVGHLLGDLLVRVPSATGRHKRRRIDFGETSHVGGLHHMRLLHHPAVYARLRATLTS